MDRKIGKGDDQKTIRDLIADPDAVDMYSDREKEKFMSDILKRGLKALSKNEKFVIQAKYDLLDDSNIEKQLKSGKGKVTNATIGNYLGISAPAVHKLHKNALRKLKSAIK
jgi:DNA-directed RNA polymerase sigma subunit (sigma70/sigma32)